MLNLLLRINSWVRNLLLEDVDKPYEGPLPYHKKFGSKKDPVGRIENRFKTQKRQSRG